ncbi:MAG: hypothetical protein JWQ14_1993, partial [Adhaeribacter sp.]|nr:hypothetical protein [Adhaeribacter sp.]
MIRVAAVYTLPDQTVDGAPAHFFYTNNPST